MVAVVGAGPSGIYAAEALSRQTDVAIQVLVLDRLPVPYGLVRYGVAPDNAGIRSIRHTLQQTLERDQVWFYGDVTIGRDLTVSELRSVTDAVIYAYGASSDRRLGIWGEDLFGSIAAPELVGWYCGHPEMHDGSGSDVAGPERPIEDLVTSTRQAVVIGAGNVALDVTRVLIKTADEQASTDMADEVLGVLAHKQVTDVHLLARRGPVQAAFTTKELRDLGKVDGLDLVLDPADFEFDQRSEQELAASRQASRNVAVMREWLDRPQTGADRRVHLHFWTRPAHINSDQTTEARVGEVETERTGLDPDGRLTAAGPGDPITAQLVVRSIGYRGLALDELAYDARTGRIPHDQGRVLHDDQVSPGEYVTGWIKRGPTGVIGSNKSDANETARSVITDLGETGAAGHDPDALAKLLADRGITPLRMADWHNIDAAEISRGQVQGRERATIVARSELFTAAQDDRRDSGSAEDDRGRR